MGRLVKNVAIDNNKVDSIGLPTGPTSQNPAKPVAGQVKFNTELLTIEVFNGTTWDSLDGSTKFKVEQLSHNFNIFNAVYFDGSNWVKAIATSAETSGIGIVSKIISPDVFEVQQTGVLNNLSDLIPGTRYYLSDTTPGLISTSEPPLISNIMFTATSATSGIVLPYRPNTASNANGAAFEQSFDSYIWTVNHNRNTVKVTYQMFDTNNVQIYPDSFTIVDANTVEAEFGSLQAGTIYLIFF